MYRYLVSDACLMEAIAVLTLTRNGPTTAKIVLADKQVNYWQFFKQYVSEKFFSQFQKRTILR